MNHFDFLSSLIGNLIIVFTMDDIKLERNCVVQPLELPLLIRKDGSVLASMKLSVSTKQLDKDKNPEILVNLNPANEFMSTVENETAKTNMKKRTKRSIFNGKAYFERVFVELEFFFFDALTNTSAFQL